MKDTSYAELIIRYGHDQAMSLLIARLVGYVMRAQWSDGDATHAAILRVVADAYRAGYDMGVRHGAERMPRTEGE